MRRALRAGGWLLTVGGALLLALAAFQLWGTDLLQARSQRELRGDFEDAQAQTYRVSGQVEGEVEGETARAVEPAPAPPPLPALGEAVGTVRIPAIGLDQVLVEGVGKDELAKGPGHYAHSVMPGELGNAALAGHRTTYGAPFNRIDELKPGDPIVVTTLDGAFTYRVSEQRIVAPDDVSVVMPTEDARLTLTTCNPKYSARERLVVVAELEGTARPPARPPVGVTVDTLPTEDFDE